MSSGRAAPVVARAATRVATRRHHHKNHARCGAPRNAPSLFYPLRYPPHVRCVLHPPPAGRPDWRAADDGAPSAPSAPASAPSAGGRAARDLYDPEALLAHPSGFLVTAFTRKLGDARLDTKKAVAEAVYLLESARDPPRTLGGAVEDLLMHRDEKGFETAGSDVDRGSGGSGSDILYLPLRPRGAIGCAYLPLALSAAAAATPFPAGHPLVALGVSALETFAADPPPPAGTPECLSRLLPVQRVCVATETNIADVVAALAPQAGLGGFVSPRASAKTHLDPFASPMTFAVRYEHHGKTAIEIDRKRLIRNIQELVLASPDYLVDDDDPRFVVAINVYHDVALCSVLPDWKRLRGYSPRGVAEARARARGEAEPAQTTSGEGYP